MKIQFTKKTSGVSRHRPRPTHLTMGYRLTNKKLSITFNFDIDIYKLNKWSTIQSCQTHMLLYIYIVPM